MFIYVFLCVDSTFILLWDVQTWLLLHVTLSLNIHAIMFLLSQIHLLWSFLELKTNVVWYINQLAAGLKVHSRWLRRFQTTLKNSSWSYIAFSSYSVKELQHDLIPRIDVLHKITIALKFLSYINQNLLPSYQTVLILCLT